MEDELWLKKIKDKLEDYSEPLPVAGWERLEKELSLSGTPITFSIEPILPCRTYSSLGIFPPSGPVKFPR